MSEATDYDAVVIGSGVGGLAAAGVLAHRGLRTAVFEQAPRVGGCCGSVRHGDYQFDVGATLVLFLEVIERYFRATGREMDDYVEFLPIEPLLEVVGPGAPRFRIPTSTEETGRVFAGLAPEAGEGWARFSEAAGSGMAQAMTELFSTPMQTFADALAISRRFPAMAGDRGSLTKSFETVLRSFFTNESILGALSLASYSVGLPPALAPGYAAFLGYSEHRGSFYPRGGMKAIPEGMARGLEEDGGELHLRSPVTAILTEGRRAIGVRLADGQEIRSRVVVGDINAKVVYGELLPRGLVPSWARLALRSWRLSQSSSMLMLALEGDGERPADDGFGTHHTLFSTGLEAMNRIWFEDYERGRPSRGGYLLGSMPSKTDPSLAPAGQHVVHLHTLAPYALADGRSWDDLRDAEAERMLDFLERDFGVEVRSRVRFQRLSTPLDLERDVGLHRGALYGLESSLFATAMFRPRIRSPLVDGLYLAGASVHLGGGIPVCIGSGLIAADLVVEDWHPPRAAAQVSD